MAKINYEGNFMASQMQLPVKHAITFWQIIAEILSVFHYNGGKRLSQRKPEEVPGQKETKPV